MQLRQTRQGLAASALLEVGRGIRFPLAAVVSAAGALLALLLMAHDGRVPLGIPLGGAFVMVSVVGLMAIFRTFKDDYAPVASSVTLRAIGPELLGALVALMSFLLALAAAAHAFDLQPLAGLLVTASFIALLASIFWLGARLGPWSLDETESPRPLHRRHGFWLLAIVAMLYLPLLGSSSLWDPWESHYAEVAREILSRDDWISTWWSWEGWFFSKPILEFWMQALAMGALGAHYQPGEMLSGYHASMAHPEWLVRTPNALFAMVGLYFLYAGAKAAFGRRAAFLGALVLATTPYWFLLAHQTMTDMPFVAAMSAAMGLVMLGMTSDAEARARIYEVRLGAARIRLTAWHLVFGAILLCALPELLYLVTRNIELVLHGAGPHGFRPHLDEFRAGSPGNCLLPGNPPCGSRLPVSHFEPVLQALVWAAALFGLLYLNRNERRTQRLAYTGAWLFAALATMAKGPAGVGLPALCVLGSLVATKRLSELGRLEILTGTLTVAAVALPWFVAMLVRHGGPFTDELIFHDMVNRALSHVHDTNEGADTSFRYYIGQLGYGLFPWTGLAPLALVKWMRAPADAKGAHASVLLFVWALVAFALFTLMGTKFHHYIFPAVSPIAMLTGLLLDGMIPGARAPDTAHESRMISAAVLAGALLLGLVSLDLVATTNPPGAIHFVHLFTYRYSRPWPATLDFHTPLIVFSLLAVFASVVMVARARRGYAVYGLLAVAVAFAAFCLDVYVPRTAPHWGQRDVIAAYYAQRSDASEPLVAYQLNWKGENFYTGNHLAVFTASGASFTSWVREQAAHGVKVMYFVTEQGRTGGLRAELAPRSLRETTDRVTSNQFVLVRVEL